MTIHYEAWLTSRALPLELMTPEFPPERAPFRPGVYWTRGISNAGKTITGWSMWDGSEWGATSFTPFFANDVIWPARYQRKYWRGLNRPIAG